jgi:hypothetical protein
MDEVTYSRAVNIAIATVASPPINALTLNVRKGLLDALERAGDIDVVYVHGYGFPAWHGGPMFRSQQQTNEEKANYA